jgi:hypothetical protein
MDVIEAIYTRRSIRSYSPRIDHQDTVHVAAPSDRRTRAGSRRCSSSGAPCRPSGESCGAETHDRRLPKPLAVSQDTWSAPQAVSAVSRVLTLGFSVTYRNLAGAKFPKPWSSCESRVRSVRPLPSWLVGVVVSGVLQCFVAIGRNAPNALTTLKVQGSCPLKGGGAWAASQMMSSMGSRSTSGSDRNACSPDGTANGRGAWRCWS